MALGPLKTDFMCFLRGWILDYVSRDCFFHGISEIQAATFVHRSAVPNL